MQFSKLSYNNDKFDKMSFSDNSSIDTHIQFAHFAEPLENLFQTEYYAFIFTLIMFGLNIMR